MYKCGHTIERQITNLGFHSQEGKAPMNILGDILREKSHSLGDWSKKNEATYSCW